MLICVHDFMCMNNLPCFVRGIWHQQIMLKKVGLLALMLCSYAQNAVHLGISTQTRWFMSAYSYIFCIVYLTYKILAKKRIILFTLHGQMTQQLV